MSVGTSNFLRSSVKSVSEKALMQSYVPLRLASIPCSQNESRTPSEIFAPVDPRRITHGHPADRHRGAGRQDCVGVDDAMDPHLAAWAHDTAGEQGSTGGQETSVADAPPVEVGMRSNQDIVTDN